MKNLRIRCWPGLRRRRRRWQRRPGDHQGEAGHLVVGAMFMMKTMIYIIITMMGKYDDNDAYPRRRSNAGRSKASMGAKSVETMVTVGVPTQSQRPIQGVDGRRRRCHLPRLLPHLITVTIAMVIRMKNTMPRLTGPDKVADPRSPMLASHTWNTGAFYTNGSFYPAGKERETGQEMLCV